MGKTAEGAIWLDKNFYQLMIISNFGEIQMIET